ncbi:MAG: glycoside hydrolase family 88 protein [Spirochaetaceae bacterium]|jgi:unsaturated rhamnogalacturonyl hydrolase|nr:glycoside hydrolase family 88 protein [Spirochaetaceae bacterium]
MDTLDKTKSLSERMALSVMNRYKPEQVKWHYEHGLVLQSIYAVGAAAGNNDYCGWVKMMYDTKIMEDGRIDTYRENEFNLDQINPGKMLFQLYKDTNQEKYRTAIETLRDQLRSHPRTKTKGFWHKQIYPWQMWLDGLYMQGPFYAEYTAEFGDPADFEDVAHQFILMESKARDPATGLLYHAWDESRKQLWANSDTGCSPHFWGRAMGWYCMALLDALDFIPKTQGRRKYIDQLLEIAGRLLVPVMKYQHAESGLWYQVLDQGKREKNYLETSASAMFIRFLYKMLRRGYVMQSDSAAVRAAADKGYDGLLNMMLKEDESGELHLHGICSVAGLGGNPYRDGSFMYYVSEPVVADDFKGVGPFIFASLEREQLLASV